MSDVWLAMALLVALSAWITVLIDQGHVVLEEIRRRYPDESR